MNWTMKSNALTLTTEIAELCDALGFNDFVASEEKIAGILSINEALMTLDEEFFRDLFESLNETALDREELELAFEVAEAQDSTRCFMTTWKGER